MSNATILVTGLAGLLAGALSMGAGEYVSVRSQRELLEASSPDPAARQAIPHLDVDTNELALVYRARGMTADQAASRAGEALAGIGLPAPSNHTGVDEREAVCTGMRAAISSFLFFGPARSCRSCPTFSA